MTKTVLCGPQVLAPTEELAAQHAAVARELVGWLPPWIEVCTGSEVLAAGGGGGGGGGDGVGLLLVATPAQLLQLARDGAGGAGGGGVIGLDRLE